MANSNKYPIQPLQVDEDNTVRFKANKIVEFLLNAGPYDMNALTMMPFSQEDREQFAQLIGYSLYGFGTLSYVSNGTYKRAVKKSKRISRGNGNDKIWMG